MANNEKIEFTVGKRAFFLQFLSILSGECYNYIFLTEKFQEIKFFRLIFFFQ